MVDTFAKVEYYECMSQHNEEIMQIDWQHAPDSGLRPRISPFMGRPRDKRFDEVIEKSVVEGPLRAEVPSHLVPEITRGLKRGARYLGTGIQVISYYLDGKDNGQPVIEFVAWRKPSIQDGSDTQ